MSLKHGLSERHNSFGKIASVRSICVYSFLMSIRLIDSVQFYYLWQTDIFKIIPVTHFAG